MNVPDTSLNLSKMDRKCSNLCTYKRYNIIGIPWRMEIIEVLVQSFYDNKGVNLNQIARNDSSPFLCSLRCSIQHIKSL